MGGSRAPGGRAASVKPGEGEPGAQSQGASPPLARTDPCDNRALDNRHTLTHGAGILDGARNHAHGCAPIDGQSDHARGYDIQNVDRGEFATSRDIAERLAKIQQDTDRACVVIHDRRKRAKELREQIASLKSELAEVGRQAAAAKAVIKQLAETKYRLRRALADWFFAEIRQNPHHSAEAIRAVLVGDTPGQRRDRVLKVIGSYRSRRTQAEIREDARRHYLERVPIATIADTHGISHQCARESIRRYAQAHPEEFTASGR